jgi:hypothetical protein
LADRLSPFRVTLDDSAPAQRFHEVDHLGRRAFLWLLDLSPRRFFSISSLMALS